MESILAQTQQAAASHRQAIPGKIAALGEAMGSQWTHGSLADAHAAFFADVESKTKNSSLAETGVNAQIHALTTLVREEGAAAIQTLFELQAWLSLMVPHVADGNNFGVEVQEMVLKTIIEKQSGIKEKLGGLDKYFSERADLWGKAIFPCVAKKSQSKGQSKKTGGEKDSNESTESEDVAMSFNMVTNDAVVAIAGHDTQQYFHLKTVMQSIWMSYVVVLDQIEKNIEKLEDPRGEIASGGGGGMSMF